jgi:uncharacterized membrane protein YcaP (DUF421 family)
MEFAIALHSLAKATIYIMDSIAIIIGEGENLTLLQMAIRAAFLFFVALFLIRFGGLRIIGKKSGFDLVIVIMLGAILSRALVGASPIFSTIVASAVMVSINKLVAWLCTKSKGMDYFFKGKPLILYANGKIHWSNMTKATLSKSDLLTSLRLETNNEDLNNVQSAYIEPNGRISFILKVEKLE